MSVGFNIMVAIMTITGVSSCGRGMSGRGGMAGLELECLSGSEQTT